MAKDDDLLPKKRVKTSSSSGDAIRKSSSSKSSGPSAGVLRVMRITCGLGIVAGGFVSIVFVMALVGTESFLIRFLVALVVVIGLPAFVADRLLKNSTSAGGLGMVANVFAIVLLGVGLFAVGADFLTKEMLKREGNRYAESGSRLMARVVYQIGGFRPTFPDEKTATPSQTQGGTTLDAGVK